MEKYAGTKNHQKPLREPLWTVIGSEHHGSTLFRIPANVLDLSAQTVSVLAWRERLLRFCTLCRAEPLTRSQRARVRSFKLYLGQPGFTADFACMQFHFGRSRSELDAVVVAVHNHDDRGAFLNHGTATASWLCHPAPMRPAAAGSAPLSWLPPSRAPWPCLPHCHWP